MDGMKRVPQDTNGNYVFPHSGEPIELKEEKEESIKFFELNLTIRAGSLDDILGLLPKAIGDFIEGSTSRVEGMDKIGSWCNDKSNYSYHLSER